MSDQRTLKNRYRIEARLGRGAMGEVFRATDLETDDVVAVKTMAPDFAKDEHYRKRFTREVAALQKLKHPNILGYVDAFMAGGHIFLVMEYVGGGTLERLIDAKEEMSVTQFKRLALKITDAVAAAHEAGVTHRDLKPANILLSATGEPKVADFGLAKLSDLSTMTATGTAMGTLAYMPPEAFDALAKQDHRGDIWALGVIFFEMLTGGALPFMGRTQSELIAAILTDKPTPLNAVRRDLPTGWNDIILHCLEHYAEFRYQSARELIEDVKAERRLFAQPGSAAAPPPAGQQIEISPSEREPRITPLGAAATTGGIAYYEGETAADLFSSGPEPVPADNRPDWMANIPALQTGEADEFVLKYMSHQTPAQPHTPTQKLPPAPSDSFDDDAPWVRKKRRSPRRSGERDALAVSPGLMIFGNLFAGSGILLIVGSAIMLVISRMPATAKQVDIPYATIQLLHTLGVLSFIVGLFFKVFTVESHKRILVFGLMASAGVIWFIGFSGFLPTPPIFQLLGLAMFLVLVMVYFRLEA
ncbi:MAG: serine/threonine protein kinase [Anaerolineae bacterium]|nr:serine/threonine protein kinase [Anaerolineae bacterium]